MRACIVMALAVAGSAAFEQVKGQEVAFASVANYEAAAEVDAPDEVVDFLLVSTDTRLMSIEEGTLGSRKGSQEIKDYAAKMVNDQRMMLGYIKKMALLRGLNLPDRVSEENRGGYDKLARVSGRKFDRKFIDMMIHDLRNDLEFFKRATNSSDEEVREFAGRCVKVLEGNLARAKELRKEG